MAYKFVKKPPAEMQEGDMLITCYSPDDNAAPVLTAWIMEDSELDEWGVITSNLPGKDTPQGSVYLDHDIAADKDFADALCGYIGKQLTSVTFGPFSTRTYEMPLKENYEELCFDEEQFFAGEEGL